MNFQCATDNLPCIVSHAHDMLGFGLAGSILFYVCVGWIALTFLKLFSAKGL